MFHAFRVDLHASIVSWTLDEYPLHVIMPRDVPRQPVQKVIMFVRMYVCIYIYI